ncbi:MAG: hypothetical protein Q9201_001001 [Fulgogasparrea decipioides]
MEQTVHPLGFGIDKFSISSPKLANTASLGSDPPAAAEPSLIRPQGLQSPKKSLRLEAEDAMSTKESRHETSFIGLQPKTQKAMSSIFVKSGESDKDPKKIKKKPPLKRVLDSGSSSNSDEATKSGGSGSSDEKDDEEVAAPVAKANGTTHIDGQNTDELVLPDRSLECAVTEDGEPR